MPQGHCHSRVVQNAEIGLSRKGRAETLDQARFSRIIHAPSTVALHGCRFNADPTIKWSQP